MSRFHRASQVRRQGHAGGLRADRKNLTSVSAPSARRRAWPLRWHRRPRSRAGSAGGTGTTLLVPRRIARSRITPRWLCSSALPRASLGCTSGISTTSRWYLSSASTGRRYFTIGLASERCAVCSVSSGTSGCQASQRCAEVHVGDVAGVLGRVGEDHGHRDHVIAERHRRRDALGREPGHPRHRHDDEATPASPAAAAPGRSRAARRSGRRCGHTGRNSSTSSGMMIAISQAPSANLLTSSMIVATNVSTAPTPLMSARGRSSRGSRSPYQCLHHPGLGQREPDEHPDGEQRNQRLGVARTTMSSSAAAIGQHDDAVAVHLPVRAQPEHVRQEVVLGQQRRPAPAARRTRCWRPARAAPW